MYIYTCLSNFRNKICMAIKNTLPTLPGCRITHGMSQVWELQGSKQGMDKLEHTKNYRLLLGCHQGASGAHLQGRAQLSELELEAPASCSTPRGWPYSVIGADLGLWMVLQGTGSAVCENGKPRQNANSEECVHKNTKKKAQKESQKRSFYFAFIYFLCWRILQTLKSHIDALSGTVKRLIKTHQQDSSPVP